MGRPRKKPKKRFIPKPIKNEGIRAPKVRVIDNEGENLGVMDTKEATQKAREQDLDLILITQKADPPVARIMEYGKYMYQQEKKERSSHKKSAADTIKGVRISMRMGDHDMRFKASRVDKFLKKGYKVRVEMMLRGREKGMHKLAEEKIREFLEAVEEPHEIEQEISKSPRGKQFTIKKK